MTANFMCGQSDVACPNLGLLKDCGIHGEDAGRAGSNQVTEGSGQYMTVQEAAKLLKIGVRTIYRYLDSGRIPRSYRLPGRRLLNREDVLAFLDKCVDERT